MKLFIACVLFAAVTADRLDNVYLPPNSGKTAGFPSSQYGAPNGISSGKPSNEYGAPSGNNNAPSNSYGAPSGPAANAYSNNVQSPEARATILRFNNENNGDGTYRFEYETENKIYQQESGELKNVGTEQEGSVVEGTYSYEGPDGVTYTVNYIADENGFRATGDHLPTPPPVPEEIQKSLDLIASQGYANGQQGYSNGQTGSNGYQQGYNNGQQGNSGEQGYQSSNENGYPSSNQQGPNKPSFNQQSGYQY